MKNVLKISLAALTFSLVMLLSPTQINASYMSTSGCKPFYGGDCNCSSGHTCTFGFIPCPCEML